MRSFPSFLIIIIFLSLTFSCKKEQTNKQIKQKNTLIEDSLFYNPYKTTIVKFKNKTFGVPSPVLLSKLTNELGIPFEANLLSDYQNADRYITTFKKAINLGIYSANLAYINIYNQVSISDKYFQVVKKLADDLNSLSHIPDSNIKILEENSENKDTLVYLVSTLFRDIDAYLLDNDQQQIGSIIIAGGWIESMFLLTQLYQKTHLDELLLKIGEQKAPLNNLLHILQPYYNQNNSEFDYLFESLADISSFYDAINFDYEYSTPEDYPQKHFTIINSKTKVNIDNLDLIQITKKIEKLRKWIIN